MSTNIVTVLLVTYNHAPYFKKAIDSVLEQKTDFDYKIWVLDDCSTDGTSDIVREYAAKYPDKITAFINAQNKGVTNNVYQALKKLDTKYYAMLEADDWWCSDKKLQLQKDALDKNPDCSYSAHNTMVETYINGELTEKNPYKNESTQKFSFPNKRKEYFEPHTSSMFYRTSALGLEDINDPDFLNLDIITNFWFLSRGKMYYIDEIMSVYNYNGNGIFSGNPYEYRYIVCSYAFAKLNKKFEYKYNKLFSDFLKKYLNLNFFTYLKMAYFMPLSKIGAFQNKLIETKKYRLIRTQKKSIISLRIPTGKNRKICLELRREKTI